MLKSIYLPFSFYIVVGFLFGIYLYSTKILLIALIMCVFIFCYLEKFSIRNSSLLIISIFVGNYCYNKQISSFQNFKNQINHHNFDVTGCVIDYTKNSNNLFKHRLTIQAETFSNQIKSFKITKHLYLYTQKSPAVYIGDEILIKDLKFNLTDNGCFDNFLIKNNIAATIFTFKLNFKKKSNSTNTFSILKIKNLLKKYKNHLLKKINLKMNKQTATIFNSVFLGYKINHSFEIKKLKQSFQTWGTVHYLARSGLHLVIISTIWQTISNLFKIPFIFSNILMLFNMLIFYLLSWSAIPFWRALIVIMCNRIYQLWHLPIHPIHILNISCILMILKNPISIFFLDFQLSFLLTYGLVFLSELSYMKKQTLLKHSIAYKK